MASIDQDKLLTELIAGNERSSYALRAYFGPKDQLKLFYTMWWTWGWVGVLGMAREFRRSFAEGEDLHV